MSRLFDSKGPAAKLAAGLAATLALTAGASYAAVRHGADQARPKRHSPTAVTTAPTMPVATAALRIQGHPPAISTRQAARFHLVVAGEPALRCRLDRRPAKVCDTTVVYRRLATGAHTFYVQALRRGHPFAHAGFDWTVLEPKPFTVAPQPAGIGPLYPGGAPSAIPVVIANPNPVAITVTALRVDATGGPAGCDPGANLSLTAPALGAGKLQIPAHSSVALPSAGVAAPTIALRELDVDQDACKGANFNLAFSGSAGA